MHANMQIIRTHIIKNPVNGDLWCDTIATELGVFEFGGFDVIYVHSGPVDGNLKHLAKSTELKTTGLLGA